MKQNKSNKYTKHKKTKKTKKNTKKNTKKVKYTLLRGTKEEKEEYQKKSNNYDNCKKKYCSKEVKLQEQIEKKNRLHRIKCNLDEKLNDKFDKYNKVKVIYDYNPLHAPFNKLTTSPCLREREGSLNDHYIPVSKCIKKHCKKESKEYSSGWP